MGFYHQFQTALKYENLILLIQFQVYTFRTIIESSCQKGFNEEHFVKKLSTFISTFINCYLSFYLCILIFYV